MAEPNEPAPPDDVALFNEATSPVEQPETPPEPKPPEPPEPAIPAGRLREEADARRTAERERDELRRRLDDVYARQQPKPETPKRSDMFEAPSAFVQEEVKPLLNPVQERINAVTEHYSLQHALTRYGDEKVGAARKALESAMGSRDSEAWGVYNRAMASIDPYGEIMRWHTSKEVISTVGTDLSAYRQKLLDEAIKDPEFQKKVFDAARGQAASTGNNVSRPVAPKLPSIGKVGAAQTSDTDDNLSDEELFQAATRRR
jgi:hypothetical protein